MKYLIVPGNNSLSHLGKALAVRDGLTAGGHDLLIAVSRARAAFLEHREIPHVVLPDIQEADGAGFPGVAWFQRPAQLAAVITAERQLLETLRPDRVLGIFHFTLLAAARLAGIPCDSLCCGCMLPGVVDALGFAPGEHGYEQQGAVMDGFFRYAGHRLSQTLAGFGLPAVSDAREMLLGERTFLWDIPEFQPGAVRPGVVHVGPVLWDGWAYDDLDWVYLDRQPRPLAILSYGTCSGSLQEARRLVRLLGELGYQVAATHGQTGDEGPPPEWLTWCRFAPLPQLLDRASLFVCHGGQLSVFEALSRQVPVAVMPFQPEQAQNGVCLEQLGWGERLVPGQVFLGRPAVYTEALQQRSDSSLMDTLAALATRRDQLSQASNLLAPYQGNALLLKTLETVP
ncbi:MAG: glycosyltransferase [Desulfuromonadales bacterium]